MPRPRVLMACANYWNSPFQVGSQHLARAFVAAGWEVAYISDPISPFHVVQASSSHLGPRWRIYAQGGQHHLDRRLWTYVPAALATPHARPILRSGLVQRHWHRWTFPSVRAVVQRAGFRRVDLLYVDSLCQAFWFDELDHAQSVYRAADYSPHVAKSTAAAQACERAMIQQADLVMVPARELCAYVDSQGARRTLFFPNGVDLEHYERLHAPPQEYRQWSGPIAVYVGVMPPWFHFDWLRQAARALPMVNFVLIGPDDLARRELAGLANVHLLGFRPYERLPGYLQHAHVGLMPFNWRDHEQTVGCLNPQKMYQYFACGLPVVSADWPEVRQLRGPARLCGSAAEFIRGIEDAVRRPGDREAYRRYAAAFDWRTRLAQLLTALGRQPGQAMQRAQAA